MFAVARNEARPGMRSAGRRRPRWWLITALAIVALVAYLKWPHAIEIEAARVRMGRLSLDLSSTGLVDARLIDLNPQITARITGLYVQEGDAVSRGQLIAQLADDDLRADVARVQAAVETATREADALDHTASSEERRSRAAVDGARASLKAADARLRELEAGTRPEDIEAQSAMVDQAEARERDAKQAYERAEELLKEGAGSAQNRDVAKANYDAAKAEVRAQEQTLAKLVRGPRSEQIDAARAEKKGAEAAYREAQASVGLAAARRKDAEAARARLAQAQAELSRASAQLAYAFVRSPVRGVAARKHRERGEVVTPLDAIFTVADLDDVWVIAEVDEENAAAVALGQPVDITLDAYPGRVIRGRVVRVSRIAEPKEVGRVRAKIVRAKVYLEPTNIPLRPGMEVNVNGYLPSVKRTMLVPNDAVTRVGDEDIVYVITRGRAKRREVRTGQSNFEDTQVLAGLKAGEVVAVTAVDQLSDGARVRVTRVRHARAR